MTDNFSHPRNSENEKMSAVIFQCIGCPCLPEMCNTVYSAACSLQAGWLRGTVVERWSLTGEFSLSCAWPTSYNWRVTIYVGKPSAVDQPTNLTKYYTTHNKAQLILVRSTFYTEVMRHYSWLGLMQSLIMDYNTLTRILLRVWTTGCYGNLKPKNSWQDLTISILLQVLKSFIKKSVNSKVQWRHLGLAEFTNFQAIE